MTIMSFADFSQENNACFNDEDASDCNDNDSMVKQDNMCQEIHEHDHPHQKVLPENYKAKTFLGYNDVDEVSQWNLLVHKQHH